MSDPSGAADITGDFEECQTCNQAPGEPCRLELAVEEGSKRLDMVLCDACASGFVAESWIDVSR